MTELLFRFTHPISGPHIPKTIILDLDETLVHSWENPEFIDRYSIYTDPVIYRKFHPVGSPQIAYSMFLDLKTPGTQSRIWGLHRPHLHEFLHFASEYADNVIVWSAGIRPYVNEIVKGIFLESGLQPPKVVRNRENCSSYQGLYHKPIYELITDISRQPFSTLKIDPAWTIIVDDKTHTFMENPNSGILIPPYQPGSNRPGKVPTMEDLLDRSDTALLQLMNWLELPEVKNATDIRTIDKSRIFTENILTV